MSREDSTTDYRGEAAGNANWRPVTQLPEKLVSLRQKLHRKAKQEPKFRFYALYDRIYRRDTLMSAWDMVRRNRGAPGVDGVTIDQIARSEGGAVGFVTSLQAALKSKSYKPQPVRRVYIPKSGGGQRPLGIPTVRDRVVQTAALLILEPIFEADFQECSYGFRPGRSAHQALQEIRGHIKAGYTEVYDADLAGYFDSIPHDKLMAGLQARISDRSVLKLIRMWLTVPVIGNDEDGPTRSESGTPQGGVISPLLANAFLNWFDRAFYGPTGPGQWANAKLVRYADDFVVLARYVDARIIGWLEGMLEGRLGLTINREKTRIVRLRKSGECLDFLGYTFRYLRDLRGRPWQYLNLAPSKRSLARARERVRELTSVRHSCTPVTELIHRVNLYLGGWSMYFGIGYPRVAFRHLNRFVRERIYRHLRRRSQRPYRLPAGQTWAQHLARLGLRTL